MSQYDLMVVQTDDGPGAKLVSFGLGAQPKMVNGPRKAAQFLLMYLLTPRGGDVVDTEYGCDLREQLLRGALRDDNALLQAVTAGAAAALDYQEAHRITLDTPANEIIESVTPLSVHRGPDNAAIVLRMITRDGDAAVIPLPLSFIPGYTQ
jgi:phage baseplate assembly protein W